MSRDELIAKIAPDNAAPVHAEGDAGLVGLFVIRGGNDGSGMSLLSLVGGDGVFGVWRSAGSPLARNSTPPSASKPLAQSG